MLLVEGTAKRICQNPVSIFIGGPATQRSAAVARVPADIYANWVPRERILRTNLWNSELSKLVANAMLARVLAV